MLSSNQQARFALETLGQISAKLESWLVWETAYLQDVGVTGESSAQQRSRTPSLRPSHSINSGNGCHPPGNGEISSEGTARGSVPGEVPAEPNSGETSDQVTLPGTSDYDSKASIERQRQYRRYAEARRRSSEKRASRAQVADPVAEARQQAERAVVSAAVQAVKGRPENYRVDVGQVRDALFLSK